jgi:hypothetical protein
MSPKCEFHDEGFESIHDSLKEIKKTFTWIIVLLMSIWVGTQTVIWTEVKSVGQRVIKLDKKVAVHVGMDTEDK